MTSSFCVSENRTDELSPVSQDVCSDCRCVPYLLDVSVGDESGVEIDELREEGWIFLHELQEEVPAG